IANNDLRMAVDLLEVLRHDAPLIAKYRHLLALCYRNAATNVFSRASNTDLECRQRAIAHLEDLIQEYPQSPEYRYDLAETYAWFDIPRLKDDDLQPAIESLRKAATIDEPLVAENPNSPEYVLSFTHVCYKLGAIHARLASKQGVWHGAKDADEAESW